ncbi:ROK family protein [Candidatus Woesearchaeota archaeon]|nr:ROK family protein [Candidatus Woesearchaeota archaeon]
MPQYIGLDIGGTKIEGILIDEKLKILKQIKIPTEAGKSRQQILSNIFAAVKQLQTMQVRGIGIGAPGFTDSSGRIQLTPNIPQFRNYKLKAALQRKLGRRIFLENDAHCFVLGEQKIGAARGLKNVVGLTLGTGVGGGAIVDGKILEGRNGGAAHFGHMIIDSNGERCYCGAKGDVESWCGGKSIERRYKQMSGKILTADKIFAAKDKAAAAIVRQYHQKLGIAVANLLNIFNPEAIVLGGSISAATDIPLLKREVAKNAQQPLIKELKIARSRLKSAAAIGAACLPIQ